MTNIKNVKDKIVFISGATDGIGKRAALELAKMGNQIIIHGRSEEKALQTVKTIKEQTGNQNVEYFLADMSSLEQIRRMTDQIRKKYDKIDVLVNNAGAQIHSLQYSEDNFEMNLAVNHFGYFLTTSRLLELVAKSDYKRIVIVSSGMHFRAEPIDFQNIQAENGYQMYPIYAQSKLFNLLFAYKLSNDLAPFGISVNSLHPGLVDTNLNPRRPQSVVERALPVEEGIKAIMHCVISPSLNGVSGKYFDFDATEKPSSEQSYDTDSQLKLWELTEEMIGEKFSFPN